MTKRKMFLFMLLALVVTMVFVFSACNNQPGNNSGNTDNGNQNGEEEDKVIFPRFKQAEVIYAVSPNIKGLTGKNNNQHEKLLLQSLQGIVAQDEAQIFIGPANDKYLRYAKKKYNLVIDDGRSVYSMNEAGEEVKVDSTNEWIRDLPSLINHYVESGAIKGYVKMKFAPGIYSDKRTQVNQACTLSGINKWLIVSEDIEADFKTACPDVAMGFDLAATNLSEYDVFKENVDKVNKDVLIMQAAPRVENLREYGIANKAGFYFYHSNTPESEKDFVYSSLNPLANAFGWEQIDVKENGINVGFMEDASVDFASQRDVNIIAADWCQNFSIWSSLPMGEVKQKESKKVATDDENVHYVTMLYSDGDNLQWMGGGGFVDHLTSVKKPEDKKMPFGWTVTANLVETMPHMINYIYETGTDIEDFVCSVSGYSYNHPKFLTDESLNQYAKDTGMMMGKADMKYLAMKGVDKRVMDAFAKQEKIEGGFVMYGAWDNRPGHIYWSEDKPFVHDRAIMWKDRGAASDPAVMGKQITKINNFSTDKTKPSGYTFIQVHCWSYNYRTIQNTFFKDLDTSKVKVVAPHEFMELIKENVEPTNNSYMKPE